MLLRSYYRYNSKILFAADAVKVTSGWHIVAYSCEESYWCGKGSSLSCNRFYPVGRPFLLALNEFDNMEWINLPCSSCVYFKTTLFGYDTPAWNNNSITNDMPDRLFYSHCALREEILCGHIREVFCDCSFSNSVVYMPDAEHRISWKEAAGYMNSIAYTMELKQVTNKRRFLSPLSLRWLFRARPKSLCILASGEKDKAVFEAPYEYINDHEDDRWICVTAQNMNENRFYSLVVHGNLGGVMCLPEIQTLVFSSTDLQGYGQGCLVFAPNDILHEIQRLESCLDAERSRLYSPSPLLEYNRIFRGPMWDESLYRLTQYDI